jgi:divalent metal cation (Fe/Co/Zn/Cd) transporter
VCVCCSATYLLLRPAATTQLLIRSAETLATGNPENTIGWVPMGIIAFTVVIKIVLWAYCATVKNSESVEAMMIDNRNDVITNSYGLVMIFFASRYYWWMDPLGAIGTLNPSSAITITISTITTISIIIIS